MTRYRLMPTDPSMAADGFALFRDAYLRARQANPLLPGLTRDHEARLRQRVERAFAHGGVAAWRGDALRGFMVAGPSFAFRGAVAALVPEVGHAVAAGEEAALVGPLYAAVADRLVREGVQLHLIGHFAADAATTASLFELGFGAIVRERLRDLSDVAVPDAVARMARGRGEHEAWLARVERVPHAVPWDRLAPLAAEHAAFYRGSPLFVVKDASLEAAVADLEAHRAAGDALFVVRDGDAPLAYLIVGPCPGETEGRLLEGTATAQVRSAFAQPASRRSGIGSALLQHAVAWARAAGYVRLFVEHETANPSGGAFWQRHFEPYLLFSMRYVDRPA
jgi:GNAT superfamily N-acetyltransferase